MYSRRGLRGYLSGFGTITAAGAVKAAQFRATSDGTTSEYAFTWDADPDLGLRRAGPNGGIIGVGGNSALQWQQFSNIMWEGWQMAGGISWTAYTTPTAISGTLNDYAPSGWTASRSGIKQDLSAAATLTGLTAVSNGNRQRIINITTTAGRNLTLAHDNAGSTAANRFWCPNLTDFVLAPGEAVDVEYDTTISRWRVMGTV